jgi:hypothetical protein
MLEAHAAPDFLRSLALTLDACLCSLSRNSRAQLWLASQRTNMQATAHALLTELQTTKQAIEPVTSSLMERKVSPFAGRHAAHVICADGQ